MFSTPAPLRTAPGCARPRDCGAPQPPASPNLQRPSGTLTRTTAALTATLLGAPLHGAADTANLMPSTDTALLENFPTNNAGGQGWLNAGTTQNYTRNRALMKFDIAAAIPAGARVTAVSLTLHVTRSPTDGDLPSTFDLHRLLFPWGEGNKSGDPPLLGAPATVGEACWTHRHAGTEDRWAAPGGAPGVDYATESSGDTYVYGVNFSPYTFDQAPGLVRDVQLWLDRPTQNFGWMLRTRSESENFSARRFAAKEDELLAPRLLIDYEVARIEGISRRGEEVTIVFWAEPGLSHVIEYCENPLGPWPDGPWQTLLAFPPTPDRQRRQVFDPIGNARLRFYRLKVE